MTNKHIKVSVLGLSIVPVSLKDNLTFCLQQEAVTICLDPYKFMQPIKEILTIIVNFKTIFSVAHALPHKFVLQFCLSNL